METSTFERVKNEYLPLENRKGTWDEYLAIKEHFIRNNASCSTAQIEQFCKELAERLSIAR